MCFLFNCCFKSKVNEIEFKNRLESVLNYSHRLHFGYEIPLSFDYKTKIGRQRDTY